MAASSGEAGQGEPSATFIHKSSGYRYRIGRDAGTCWLEFEKIGNTAIRGKKPLAYFIGSGAVARSYVLQADSYLYEAPVAYYSASAKWSMAPSYDTYSYPYLTRAIQPGCLNCHASLLAAIPNTQNRYGPQPFREGGVACERCHGPGEAHIEKMRSGRVGGDRAIVNPAKLGAGPRDSVCAQCHLSGDVRVMRPGATWNSYQPGGRLADYITVFVRAGTTSGMRVTSHFEKLAQSKCKQGAGDRLSCGSCHDPHSVPDASQRAAWFRQKCLACHASRQCSEPRASRMLRKDDCTTCHMPKGAVTDAQHVVYTDHSIPRRPRLQAGPPSPKTELAPFGGGKAATRDLALAYAIAAGRTHGSADQARALRLLEEAARESPEDTEVLLYLAEIYRNGGREEESIPLYRRAIRLDPAQVTASVGLGAILFQRGQYPEAILLWQDALAKNPGVVLVGTNLAMAEWRAGDLGSAKETIRKVIDLSPAFQPARELLSRFEQFSQNQ
jgi:hypothetical protein